MDWSTFMLPISAGEKNRNVDPQWKVGLCTESMPVAHRNKPNFTCTPLLTASGLWCPAPPDDDYIFVYVVNSPLMKVQRQGDQPRCFRGSSLLQLAPFWDWTFWSVNIIQGNNSSLNRLRYNWDKFSPYASACLLAFCLFSFLICILPNLQVGSGWIPSMFNTKIDKNN